MSEALFRFYYVDQKNRRWRGGEERKRKRKRKWKIAERHHSWRSSHFLGEEAETAKGEREKGAPLFKSPNSRKQPKAKGARRDPGTGE